MTVDQVLGYFGVSLEVAETAARAVIEPTSSNIKALTLAYAEQGQVPPPKLIAWLIQENQKRYPQDSVITSVLPWLIGGVLALYLIFRRRT